MAVIKLYPSSISTVLAWTNANNALTDNGVYATTAGARNSNHEIIGSNFDLSSIPSGSTINSVALEVKYKLSTTASGWTGTLLAVKNGSQDNGTEITTTTEPTTDTIWQNTGTGSYTLETLAQLGVLFRVRRSSNTACTYLVDYLAIVVDYTAPTETTIDVPVTTVSGGMFAPTFFIDTVVDVTTMSSTAKMESAVPILVVSIDVPNLPTGYVATLIPTVSAVKNVLINSTVSNMMVSAKIPELRTDNIFLIPKSDVSAQAHAPVISIKYDALIQIPVTSATATMLTPFRETTAKLMTIDSLLNLFVLGEIVEGAVVNLDKYGVLTIVEIVEGSTFNLSSTGVLTINTVTEGGV